MLLEARYFLASGGGNFASDFFVDRSLALFSAEIPKSFSKESLVYASPRADDWQRLLYS